MATSLELAARRFYDMSIVKHFGWKSISAEILSSHRMEGNDVLVTIYNGPFLISSCWMEHFCQSGEQLLHPSSSSQLLFSFLLLCVSFPSSICLLSFGLCLCGGGGGVGWGGGGGGGGQGFLVLSFMAGLPLLCCVAFYVATRREIFMHPSFFLVVVVVVVVVFFSDNNVNKPKSYKSGTRPLLLPNFPHQHNYD